MSTTSSLDPSEPALTDRLPSVVARTIPALTALSSRGLEAAAKFGLYGLSARLLGGHDAGEFFLCLSIVHVLATFSRMGLDRALTRHVAAELAVSDMAAVRRKSSMAAGGVLGVSTAVGLLTFLTAAPLAETFHHPDLLRPIQLAALMAPLNNVLYVVSFILMGFDRGAMAQFLANAAAPLVGLAALLLGARSTEALVLAYSGAFAAAALAGFALIVRAWRRGPAPGGDVDRPAALPTLWASAKPLFAYDLAQAFLLSLPTIALSRVADLTSLSDFSITNRLSMLAATVAISIGQFASAAIARHHRRGETLALRGAYGRARNLALAITLPLLLLMAVLAKPLLAALGAPSPMAVVTLRLLIVSQLVYCLLPCLDMVLAMTGHGDALRRLTVVQLIVCLALALTLPATYGAVGAALVCIAQWSIVSVGSAFAVWRFVPELRPGIFNRRPASV